MAIAKGLELSCLEFADELVHGELGWSADKAGDLHCPVLKSSSQEAKAKIAMNLSFQLTAFLTNDGCAAVCFLQTWYSGNQCSNLDLAGLAGASGRLLRSCSSGQGRFPSRIAQGFCSSWNHHCKRREHRKQLEYHPHKRRGKKDRSSVRPQRQLGLQFVLGEQGFEEVP
ncbi:hypothetical protein PS1_023281 [Malus domestica]